MVSNTAFRLLGSPTVKTLPAPVGGWDAESALADMPEENAVILDNWFPDTDGVLMRRGSAEHATGLGAPVESVLTYTPENGVGEMFGAAGGNIYDATVPGLVGAPVVTGMLNSRWQHEQISTPGGHFLVAVNGEDVPRQYDGANWIASTIGGPDPTKLEWINLHHRRLFFGERDNLDFWYLDVNSVTGIAQRFTLGAVARRGGFIMAMGTWTRDAGDGQDDVAVFLTSEGEAIVYQGTDPNSAVTWALIGVFRIGKPIGRRCFRKAGGDLLVITEDGFISISTQLAQDRAATDRNAVSKQINRAVNDATQQFGNAFGWEILIYNRARMLIFNVPQGGTYHQYVFNTITTKPSRFIGVDALAWGLINDNAYFGKSDGTIHEFDTGISDNGVGISFDALQAFSYFGTQSVKAFKKAQPLFQSSNNPSPALDLNIDFQIRAPMGGPVQSSTTAGLWGISLWGVDSWGSASQVFKGWRGVKGIGRSASLRIRIANPNTQSKWISTDYVFVRGGIL